MTLTDQDRRVVDPAPPSTEVLFREARLRRRRRRQGWASLILFAAIAVVTAAVLVCSTGPRSNRAQTHKGSTHALPAGTPSEIVGWTSDFHLVVIKTTTGGVLRTLASNVAVEEPGLPAVSVAPDGDVFFDSAPISGISPPDAQGDQIFRVPIAGGPVVEVGPGFDPEVSPDGRYLAYVASATLDEAPYLLPAGGIAIANLAGGSITNPQLLHPSRGQLNQGVSDLSWSPDSQRLSFDLLEGTTDATTSWTIAPRTAGASLASATQIPIRLAGLTWSGYWKVAANGSPLGVGVLTSSSGAAPQQSPQTIVSIDPKNGKVIDPYFSVPAAVCTPSEPPRIPANCVADFSNALAVSPTGTSILIAGAVPIAGGVRTTSGASYLYRWSMKSGKPVKLKEGVLVAAWGPWRS